MSLPTLSGPRQAAASGTAKQLIVLLHGYGADGNDLFGLVPALAPHFPDAAFVSPDAPFRCEMGFGFQWFPLADRSLKKGAAVIGSTGVPFTTSSIGMAMASRDLMSNLRAMGETTGGPKPMSARDRSRFLSAPDEVIQRLKRRGAALS